MNAQNGTLLVSAIKNGTVIDHINAGMALKILSILNLNHAKHTITVGINLKSKSKGRKDIIKIEDWEVDSDTANKIAIFSPDATVNIVSNFNVSKKYAIHLPKKIAGLVVCPNPKCITNNETMDSLFYTTQEKNEVKLSCHYCEKVFQQSDVKSYKY